MLTTNELIKNEIECLMRRESSDFLTLFRQVEEKKRVIKWNLAQKISQSQTFAHSIIYDEWGRGTGKTTHLTKKMKEGSESMPRGLGLFVVPTYSMFSTEIYSSLTSGFEANGWFEGLHYWVGKEPPRNWNIPRPYKSPKSFERCIYTWTGFVYIVASQDANNAGVGTSVDIQLSDESALLNWNYMSTVIFPTVRGSGNRNVQQEFAKRSKYFSKHFFHSSTPMNPSGQELLYGLESGRFSEDLQKMGIGGVCVVKANYKFNKQNLAPNFEQTQRILIPDKMTYEAQVLNIRPPSVSGGYYVGLNKNTHAYFPLDNGFQYLYGAKKDCRSDSDILKGKPLQLAIDWGDVINSLVILQQNGKEIRALNNMYVLGDSGEMQDDLAQKFCDYYAHIDAADKIAEMWYDATGNIHIGNSYKTRAQQFADVLRKNGWKVFLKTKYRKNIDTDKRKLLWENILKEGKNQFNEDKHDPRFPYFRINEVNCAQLWTSMANTPAKMGPNNRVTKDKRSESRGSKVLPQHATHLGDAIDSYAWGAFFQCLKAAGIALPDSQMQ